MTREANLYFTEGCGRCPLGGTPQCKVHLWPQELAHLRRIVRDCGLTEECKWGMPCYTFGGKNVVLVNAFKDFCCITFFKGSLLQDTENILYAQTENMQGARLARFTDVKTILEMEATLKAYLFEAIEVEKAGLSVAFKPVEAFSVPAEFQQKLADDPALRAAFEALTPGRQKGYLLHFAAPKQAKTRESRIEKYIPLIFAGKGLHD